MNEFLILKPDIDITRKHFYLLLVYYFFQDHAAENENKYDAVVASEIIEHVNNKDIFVQSCIKVLKPGGRIFFTTPNKNKWSEFVVIFMAENILRVAPKGLHDIEKFITPNDLTLMLERSKLMSSYFFHE